MMNYDEGDSLLLCPKIGSYSKTVYNVFKSHVHFITTCAIQIYKQTVLYPTGRLISPDKFNQAGHILPPAPVPASKKDDHGMFCF